MNDIFHMQVSLEILSLIFKMKIIHGKEKCLHHCYWQCLEWIQYIIILIICQLEKQKEIGI